MKNQKSLQVLKKTHLINYEDGLLELYKKIRPGEPLAVDSAESLITSMFFDPRRYDLAKVGRYKFNKKLALKNRIGGQVLAEDVASPMTGKFWQKQEPRSQENWLPQSRTMQFHMYGSA